MTQVVLGLLDSLGSAEVLLNNLAEADFGARATSAIARTPSATRLLARSGGPLAGATADSLASRLSALGLAEAKAAECQQAVRAGRVLVAVLAEGDDEAKAAAEMLGDARATDVSVVAGAHC